MWRGCTTAVACIVEVEDTLLGTVHIDEFGHPDRYASHNPRQLSQT